MNLSHPKTNPSPSLWEKLSSTKLVPGSKKVGDLCFRGFLSLNLGPCGPKHFWKKLIAFQACQVNWGDLLVTSISEDSLFRKFWFWTSWKSLEFLPRTLAALWGGGGLGWSKGTAFIVHFISIIITSASPQIARHQIPEAGGPCSKDTQDSSTLLEGLHLLYCITPSWALEQLFLFFF